MRVTQSMLSNNLIRNLSNSYGKMSKLQEQLQTGSKINRPSDDPVTAVNGMGYRRDLAKVEQYQRNMITANSWLDTTDESLNQVGEQIKRVRELVTQAANDTNTPDEREKMKMEIDQIRQQIQDVANTKIGDSYIFSGTNTGQPLYIPATPPNADGSKIMNPDVKVPEGEVKIEIYDGIQLQVNTPGQNLFKDIDDLMGKISGLLGDPNSTGEEIGDALGGVDKLGTGDDITAIHNKVLAAQADIGARQNRVEMMDNRLSLREVSVTKQISDNEDVDYAKAITELVTNESIHQAALSVGSKIIQQTLVDFIR